MSKTRIVCIVALGLLPLIGCEKKDGEGALERAGKEVDKAIDQAGKAADQALKEAGKAADSAMKVAGDAAILGKIKAKLAADAVLKALSIEITVEEGQVMLKGMVDSEGQSANVEKIAKETEGVKGVENDLEVKKAE